MHLWVEDCQGVSHQVLTMQVAEALLAQPMLHWPYNWQLMPEALDLADNIAPVAV